MDTAVTSESGADNCGNVLDLPKGNFLKENACPIATGRLKRHAANLCTQVTEKLHLHLQHPSNLRAGHRCV